jgi:hypothetical protein
VSLASGAGAAPMKYLTTIEEQDGVLRMEICEPDEQGATTVALLACVLGPSAAFALRELLRVAIEAFPLGSGV